MGLSIYSLPQNNLHTIYCKPTPMALNGNHQIFYSTTTGAPCSEVSLRRPFLIPSWTPSWSHPRTRPPLTIVSASKKFSSSRTGKFDRKNRRSSVSTKEEEEEEYEKKELIEGVSQTNFSDASGVSDDGFEMPELPGDKPDFWEGPQWDGFGFFVQYLWAFGIVFAVIPIYNFAFSSSDSVGKFYSV